MPDATPIPGSRLPRDRPLLGRDRELLLLRELWEAPGSGLVRLSGPPGVGRTALLRHGLPPGRTVHLPALPLPDEANRRALLRQLEATELAVRSDADPPPLEADWSEIVRWLTGAAERSGPVGLVLDDVEHLLSARPSLPRELAEEWERARSREAPVRWVLSSSDSDALDRWTGQEAPLPGTVDVDVELKPLPYRTVAGLFPEYAPEERLVAWSVFGGTPGRLVRVDATRPLGQAVVRAVLDPDGPLHDEPFRTLAPHVQAPARYLAVLGAVSEGAQEWGAIVSAAGSVESGSRMAPYLRRLERLGRVRAERSLDAGPRSRRRRYRPVDPFEAFWFARVLPHRAALVRGHAVAVWRDAVRPALLRHLASFFPRLAREYLSHHAHEALGAPARDVGGLWGGGYDIDAAGTLTTGAVCYARAVWDTAPVDEGAADRLSREMDRTRWGLGKEARHRLVLSRSGFSEALRRRAAREPLVHVVGLEGLLGDG